MRLLLRQEKTFKVRVNHFVPDLELKAMPGTEKAFSWLAVDSGTDDGKPEHFSFSIRFNSADRARVFKETWEKARKQHAEVAAGTFVAKPKPAKRGADEAKSETPAKADAPAAAPAPAAAAAAPAAAAAAPAAAAAAPAADAKADPKAEPEPKAAAAVAKPEPKADAGANPDAKA